MLWSPFIAIFSEVLYKGYITKTTKSMYRYEILSFKYAVHNICYNIVMYNCVILV